MGKKEFDDLNKREKAILKYIEKQIKANSYPPSVREIGKAVGLSSTATVHGYLAKLEEKGYIKKESQKGRTLRLLKGILKEEKKEEPKQVYTSREMVDVGLTATLLAFLSVCTFVCYDVFHGRIKYPVEYILIIMIGLLWVIMLFLSTVIGTTNISEKVGVYYNKEFGTLIGIFSFWLMNTMIRYYKYVFFILPYKKSDNCIENITGKWIISYMCPVIIGVGILWWCWPILVHVIKIISSL